MAPVVGASSPTGTVSFDVGTTALCTVTLVDGYGSCTTDAEPSGDDTVIGTYSGDPADATSSGSGSLTVKYSTTTVLSYSLDWGQNVGFVVSVDMASGPTPTGTVAITAGSTPLCTVVLEEADN